MANPRGPTFWRNEDAAIAPMYAIALFGLVGIAGVGWDYGRMMAMDTELQNAADQAALAAATQLDGGADAMIRARNAANTYLASAGSEWVNETRMSNDGSGRPITSLTFRFYESYDSEDDTFGTEITDDTEGADANIVQVIVNGREAFFALTPVVGAISSGDITADAVAGVQESVCNVPPLMFCAPTGAAGFPSAEDVGKGVAMHMRANQSEAWAPGNFGFLDIEYVNVSPSNGNHLTGLMSEFLGCAGDEVESRTGSRTPELRALNTRFDIYGSGAPRCESDGDFCPSQNTTKNWVVPQRFSGSATPEGPACATSPNNPNWVSAASTAGTTVPATSTGFPRDTSTVDGFGNGQWSGANYMAAHHPGSAISDVPDLDGNLAISRYEVYQWELGDMANRLVKPRKVGYNSTLGNNGRYSGDAYCAYPQPVSSTPVVPTSNIKDRRVITVAAVDCSGLNGHAPVNILRWVDLFLVQPADDTAADKSFYGEIIGEAEPPGADESAFQAYGKNKPVLLR
jgi:hypothetical protein